MNRLAITVTMFLAIFAVSSACNAGGASAKDTTLTGWEKDSEYNKLYDLNALDKLKGTIGKFITVTPLPGMAPGTAFILEESEDEKIVVHLCPESYADAGQTGLKRGDKVKVKGSWAEIDGKDVFLASKVKKGDYFEFKVRLTGDGTPFWTMTAEQLAIETKRSE